MMPDAVDWIQAHCFDAQTVNTHQNDYSRARRIILEDFQKRITRRILSINPHTGRFPYRTIVYSAPKKSGKSGYGACFTSYFAKWVESPNAIFILANDREQSSSRVFAAAAPTLKALGGKADGKYRILMPNGTVVQASTSDPEKEAGGSYGLTVWDELWGFKSERSRLLFDELMPIATRTNSMRLVVTYAGFEDTSDLLLSLYLKVFKDTTETQLTPGARPVAGLEDITTTDKEGNTIPCCYEVPELSMFYYNDHEQRMPWQRGESGAALIQETEGFLTEENVYRLTQNRWQITESRFLDPLYIRSALKAEISPRRMTFAIDASERFDNCALVGSYERDMRYVTAFAKTWNPGGRDIDIEETVIAELLKLYRAGLVARRTPQPGESAIIEAERLTPIDVWFDPFQMHQVAMNLRKNHRLLMARFTQKTERLLADSFLRKQYHAFNIDICDNSDLVSHLEAAKAEAQTGKDTEDKIRIIKATGDHAKPIDLAVAQSMSVYRCSQRPRRTAIGGVVQGTAKGWT